MSRWNFNSKLHKKENDGKNENSRADSGQIKILESIAIKGVQRFRFCPH